MYRMQKEKDRRQSEPKENLDLDGRTSESYNENVDASVYAIDEWLLEKVGQPQLYARDLFRILQLLPEPQDLE